MEKKNGFFSASLIVANANELRLSPPNYAKMSAKVGSNKS